MSIRDLKGKLSEFLEEQETFWMNSDELAEIILRFLTEEYDRQIEEVLVKVRL
jgi:hypothetical protein